MLALCALGQYERAASLFADMQHLRDPDGSYWTGYVFGDNARWPEERTTWTAAAVLLAARSNETGQVWAVQPNREPVQFRFPNVPGPRDETGAPVGPPPTPSRRRA